MSLFGKTMVLAVLVIGGAIAGPTYTFEAITPCSACGSLVSGINNSGQIAGSAYDSSGAHAFTGSAGTFTVFDAPGASFTEAIGLSNTGRVTVNYLLPNNTGRSYILEPNGTTTLLPVVGGANYTLGGNLNDSGTAVGFYGNTFDGSSSVNAFILRGTTLNTFSYPGAIITQALGINNAGVIVGEYLTSGAGPPHGFIRGIDGTLQGFDVPGSIGTQIFDIDNHGSLAGEYTDALGVEHGFVYRDGDLSTLDFGANTTVFGINDLGQAVGASYPAGGFFTGPYSGFIATPVPEPRQLDLPIPDHRVVISRKSTSFEYANRDHMIFGVDGDTQLVFVTEPLNKRIAVLDRFSGDEIGELPPPPDGFLLPFSIRVPAPGRLVVLDAGGFPNPAQPAIPQIYDYVYHWNPATSSFTAAVSRTISFAGLPVVFAEDVEVTSSGLYVVAESVLGALWVVQRDGSVVPGVFPTSGTPIPSLAPCALPPVTIGGIPFATAGNFAPGVISLASRNGQLLFGTTCNGGVYRIPIDSLIDPSRTPEERAGDIAPVSARPAGTVEAFEGLATNRFSLTDNAVYACDSFHLGIIRIDLQTGAREVIATDPLLFNFPTRMQFLPPFYGKSVLVVASDQEYRMASINATLATDVVQPPWIITKVLTRR